MDLIVGSFQFDIPELEYFLFLFGFFNRKCYLLVFQAVPVFVVMYYLPYLMILLEVLQCQAGLSSRFIIIRKCLMCFKLKRFRSQIIGEVQGILETG